MKPLSKMYSLQYDGWHNHRLVKNLSLCEGQEFQVVVTGTKSSDSEEVLIRKVNGCNPQSKLKF